MDEHAAQALIRAVEANWNFDMMREGRTLWRRMLADYTKQEADEAFYRLAQQQKHKPSWAHMQEMLSLVRKHQRDKHKGIDNTWAKERTPEWVHVWSYLRFRKHNFDMLPQQNAPHSMTMQQYELVKAEWVKDGSPRMDPRKFGVFLQEVV